MCGVRRGTCNTHIFVRGFSSEADAAVEVDGGIESELGGAASELRLEYELWRRCSMGCAGGIDMLRSIGGGRCQSIVRNGDQIVSLHQFRACSDGFIFEGIAPKDYVSSFNSSIAFSSLRDRSYSLLGV